MKRCLCLLFVVLLLVTGCSADPGGAMVARAKKEKDLLTKAALEMRAFGLERTYVALEVPEPEETAETVAEIPTAERLVRYFKQSDERVEVDSPVLEQALRDFGFALILFQTASDGRESVIFSTGKETETGPLRGLAYSFDGEAVAWWGRAARLTKHKGRYVEINPKGDAWYFTVSLGDGLWYWEKNGSLLG